MSSFLGHSLIAAALGVRNQRLWSRKTLVIALIFSTLGISPDFDFIVGWVFGYWLQPRYTHSLGYCTLIGVLAVIAQKKLLKTYLDEVPAWSVFVAPSTHLLLDYLMGIFPIPLFWLLSVRGVYFPLGFLPAAGKLDLANYYFWRNMLIEAGILFPVAVLIQPQLKHALEERYHGTYLLLMCIFTLSMLVGVNLSRPAF